MDKRWLKAAAVRAARTVAQTAIATIGSSAVLADVDWMMVASASVLAGILSLLASIGGLPECCSSEKKQKSDESSEF